MGPKMSRRIWMAGSAAFVAASGQWSPGAKQKTHCHFERKRPGSLQESNGNAA